MPLILPTLRASFGADESMESPGRLPVSSGEEILAGVKKAVGVSQLHPLLSMASFRRMGGEALLYHTS